jgi:hypothetical protein
MQCTQEWLGLSSIEVFYFLSHYELIGVLLIIFGLSCDVGVMTASQLKVEVAQDDNDRHRCNKATLLMSGSLAGLILAL